MPNFNPINPNKYVGTNKYITFFVSRKRRPTLADYRQPETGNLYSVGTVWQVAKSPTTGTEGELWMLSKIVANQGFWILVSSGAISEVNSFMVDTFTGPGTNPVLPTVTGVVTVTGGQIANASLANVIRTDSLAANAFTIEIQRAASNATTDLTKNGVSHFNSGQFTVDANGFVSLAGAGLAVDSFAVMSLTAPGVNPVAPDATGLVTINAAAVAAHSIPIETRTRALNAYNIEVQEASAVAATDITKSGISHFNNVQFTVDANGFVSLVGAGAAGQTITTDDAVVLIPTAGNWNILGQKAGTIAVVDTVGTLNSTLRIEDRTWTTSFVVDPSATVGLRGTFQTITAALAAASAGNTIFVRPGTYTENFTWPTGINIVSFNANALSGSVTIIGKITATDAGSRAMTGIRLQTNGDFFLVVSGSAATKVSIEDCYLNCTNNTGISYTSSDTGSNISILDCSGNLATTGITYIVATSAGSGGPGIEGVLIDGCKLTNTGNSSTPSSTSACLIRIISTEIECGFTTSATGAFSGTYANLACSNFNTSCLISAGTSTNDFYLCKLLSGTASCLSIGAGTTSKVYKSTIDSTNTNAVTGAGTYEFGDVTYVNTSVANVTTVDPKYTDLPRYKATQQPSFSAYLASTDSNVTGDGTNFTLGTGTAMTELFDIGGNFNTNGTFTAPVTGKYQFNCTILAQDVVSTMNGALILQTTSLIYTMGGYTTTVTGTFPISFSVLAQMTAGDTAIVKINFGSGTKVVDIYGGASDPRTFFQGYLVG